MESVHKLSYCDGISSHEYMPDDATSYAKDFIDDINGDEVTRHSEQTL